MISLIIIAILAMSLISVISLNMLELSSQTEQVLTSSEERMRFNTIKSLVRQSMRPLGHDQTLIPLVGADSDSGYMTLPKKLSVNSKNAWGLDYLYCPYSLVDIQGSSNGSVKTSVSTSYNIYTVTDSEGLTYVQESEPSSLQSSNVLAAIISPLPGSSTPACEELRFDNETKDFYTLNRNGIVEVIREESFLSSSNSSLSYDFTDSTGDDFYNQSLIWNTTQPDVLTFNLPSGVIKTESLEFKNKSELKNKQVIFSGNGLGETFIDAKTSSEIDISFENMVVKFNDMEFTKNVTLNFINSDVYLNDVRLTDITTLSSNLSGEESVYFSPNETINLAKSNADFEDANFTFDKSTSSIGLNLTDSKVILGNSSLNNNSSGGIGVLVDQTSSLHLRGEFYFNNLDLLSGFSINSSGKLTISNSSIHSNNDIDTIIYTKGNTDIKNSNISMSTNIAHAILLDEGSELTLNDSSIGNSTGKPNFGVRDLGGAKFISGRNTNILATGLCWDGNIFYLSPQSNGSYSSTSDQNYQMANKSNWLCSIY